MTFLQTLWHTIFLPRSILTLALKVLFLKKTCNYQTTIFTSTPRFIDLFIQKWPRVWQWIEISSTKWLFSSSTRILISLCPSTRGLKRDENLLQFSLIIMSWKQLWMRFSIMMLNFCFWFVCSNWLIYYVWFLSMWQILMWIKKLNLIIHWFILQLLWDIQSRCLCSLIMRLLSTSSAEDTTAYYTRHASQGIWKWSTTLSSLTQVFPVVLFLMTFCKRHVEMIMKMWHFISSKTALWLNPRMSMNKFLKTLLVQNLLMSLNDFNDSHSFSSIKTNLTKQRTKQKRS